MDGSKRKKNENIEVDEDVTLFLPARVVKEQCEGQKENLHTLY